MAIVRVSLLGALNLHKDGAPLRLRTLQQNLLLAQLALAESPIERTEIATLLWPEAERENALAYLRRALMELRRAGIEIESPGTGLALCSATTDLDDLLEITQGAFTLLPSAEPLREVSHPAAEMIRHLVLDQIHARQRLRAAPPPLAPKTAPDLIRWLWDAILREKPEIAAETIATHALTLVAEFPSEPLLEICQKVLGTNPPLGPARVTLGQVAGRSAHVLTRYALAERFYRGAVADAEALGRLDLASQNLGTLAFLKMERREWAEARALGERAIELAERSDDPAILEGPLQNLAGTLWHLKEFEVSAELYRRAIAVSLPPKRIVPEANLAYLWGVFGVEPGMPFQPDLSAPTDGYRGLAEAYLAFGCGMGEDDPVLATVAATRLFELTAKSGMERLFIVAIDCAAMALARQGRPVEAAACVRIGSRVRRDLDHLRSPGERLAIRRNIDSPFFESKVADVLDRLPPDPQTLGTALRLLLGSK